MKDDVGIVQLWAVSPGDGLVTQLTNNPWDIASAFTWSPDGGSIAHAMDNSVFLTDALSGQCRRMTDRVSDEAAPLSEACVFSPDENKVAFMRRKTLAGVEANHICVVFLKADADTK